jgi:hypothetical protein
MVTISCRWSVVVAAVITGLLAQSALAKSSARVERTTVNTSESLQITFETDQSVSGQPDFAALQDDFEILGTSRSTNVSIINGRMQRSARWVVEVLPKREGTLVIPAIKLGKESTAPVNITVSADAPGTTDSFAGDISLEVDVDNLAPYVQEQIIFTVRIVHAVSFDQASLSDPVLSSGDAIIEKLGDDVAYESSRGANRVAILERRYAIFPQNSDPMTIAPLRFDGRIANGGRSRFDPFARSSVVRKRTDAIEITPKPIPAGFSGSTWLPARQLMLVEMSPEAHIEYRVGEPFTRTLTLQATGLSASQLPEINAAIPDTVRQYPDQPVLENRVSADSIVGIRHEKMALIPAQAGLITLPAIEVPWWDTGTGKIQYATLPARTIDVLPALGGNASTPPPTAAATAQPAATDSESGSNNNESVQPLALGDRNIWPWVSLLLAAGWLVTLLGWLRSRQRTPVKAGPDKTQTTEKQLLRDLRRACAANDAAAAKSALLQWAAIQWPGDRIHSMGELAARFEGDLQQHLHALSQHLYSRSTALWDGEQLWTSFAARPQQSSVKGPKQAELEPLYR